MHHEVNINVIIHSTRTGANAEMGSHNPKISRFLPYLQQYITQEANCRGNTEEAVLWGVSICLDPFLWGCFSSGNVTNVLDRILWWLQLVSLGDSLPFPGQQSRGLQLSRPPSVGSAAVARRRDSSSQVFPESLVPPFLVFPIHKVNQESCNYGALEWAESCAELSSSQQVGSMFSPQKTVSLPLLSRPIILAVYERISLSPSVSPYSPTHTTQPGTFYYPYFGTRSLVSLFWDCSPFFLLLQLTVTSETGETFFLRLQETCFYA